MLFPTLTSMPFHEDRSAHPPRLAEAVLLLERMAPVDLPREPSPHPPHLHG